MQRVFLSMIARHPLRTLKIYLLLKPPSIAGMILRLLQNIRFKVWLALIIEPFVLCGLVLASRAWREVDEVQMAWLAAVAVLFAALPNLWAYPSPHTVADLLLSVAIALQVVLWAIVMWTARHGLAAGWIGRRASTLAASSGSAGG